MLLAHFMQFLSEKSAFATSHQEYKKKAFLALADRE
jgi:hypothetical protein